MTWKAPAPHIIDLILKKTRFDAHGLIAAIAQDENGQVLMLAWMNQEALTETLKTGRVCYYSRSRQKLWRKGETSGQEQHLLHADLDCDADALLLTVQQKGVACHTGRRSCFYQRITPEGPTERMAPEVSPETLYQS
ncbi:phosphoribosyl-AMP cyclohydrolase [Saccharibacter sp. 17.LH.SD]|uniref:phosphoribosyl-AMP cyclohydrolase n=1 Tax=Saccharibacter sp. 17.LH.SD TaxID=2689393 RepID=UPI0013684412|nr:phosphoribosyl-AMP cyclohydrolase [Saccharibacter sp. 17.LH.SD]MXV44495.1 phosphoribosyl-AMP cyclohydrolase [Saccharibacter sp. 17.LH.SD]